MNIHALILLWNATQKHPDTSGGITCARILLSLYNGDRFPMALTDLRSLDRHLQAAAMAVIAADAQQCQMEVHEWLNDISGRYDFGRRFEHMAYFIKARKRAKKDELGELDVRWLVLQMPSQSEAA